MATGFRQWNDDFVVEHQQKCVSININGEFENSKVLYLDPEWTLQNFLSAASQRLDLFPTASRLFNADGVEIDDCMMIVDDDLLFLSNGADFSPPSAKGFSGEGGSDSDRLRDKLTSNEENVPATIGGYRVGKVIGRGAFGEVRIGEHHLTNERVALKYLRKSDILSIGAAERTAIEVQCLGALKHNNIIRLHTQLESPSHVVIVFELMEGGDLSAYLNARGNSPAEMALSEEDARPLFHQVLSAVGYAHNQHICHRDLKLENILLKYVNSLSVVKVADFGLSDFYRPGVNKKSYCGTLAFIAPEVFKGTSNAGPPLDIWSMGVILFAALCGRLPFDPTPNQIHDNRPREQIIRQKIVACQYKIDEKLGPEAKDLVRRMLKVDPTERASIPEIFNHVWLRPISNTIIDFTPTTTSSALSSMNSGIPGGGVGVSGGPKVSSETVASEGSRATVDGRSISPASVFGVKGAASISQASRNSSFNYNADNAQFTPHLQDSIDVIANPTSEDARDGESVGKTRSVSSSRAPSVSQIEGCSSTNDLQADEVDTRTSGVTTPQLSSVEPVVRASSFIASSSAQPSSFKLVPLRRQVDNRTTSRDQLDELDELYVNVNQALVSQSLTDSLSPAPSGRIGATAVDGSQRPYSTHTSRNHSDHVSKSNNSSSRARTPDFATSISSSRVLRSKLRNEQLAVNHSLGSGTGFGQSSTTNAHVGTKYTTSPNQRQRPAVNRGLRSFTTDGTLDFEQSLTPPPSYNSAPSSGKYMK